MRLKHIYSIWNIYYNYEYILIYFLTFAYINLIKYFLLHQVKKYDKYLKFIPFLKLCSQLYMKIKIPLYDHAKCSVASVVYLWYLFTFFAAHFTRIFLLLICSCTILFVWIPSVFLLLFCFLCALSSITYENSDVTGSVLLLLQVLLISATGCCTRCEHKYRNDCNFITPSTETTVGNYFVSHRNPMLCWKLELPSCCCWCWFIYFYIHIYTTSISLYYNP